MPTPNIDRPAGIDVAAATGCERRIRTVELLELVGAVAGLPDIDVSALLVIRVGRSDRVAALAQRPEAAEVLRQISARLSQCLRIEDRFATASHDEIWVLLPALANDSVATLAAARLRDVLTAPVSVRSGAANARAVPLHPAIGVLLFGYQGAEPLELLRQADLASHSALRNEDRVVIQQSEHSMSAADRSRFEADLRQALFANELELMLQPKVDLHSGRVMSAEALIRWVRSDGSVVGGGVVASTCAEGGLIDPLTRFVLHGAMRAHTRLQQAGFDVSIAVNLDAATIGDMSFPELVEQASLTWGVAPSKLIFEITEGSIVDNERRALEFMDRLRALGAEISLDDFGTGYSSLAYLRHFPLSELKIDKLFVSNVTRERNDRRIVRSLVALCRSFGLRCVAEGIEDEQTRSLLAELGCDLGQGFLFSPPIPSDRFGEWVRNYDAQRSALAETALAVD